MTAEPHPGDPSILELARLAGEAGDLTQVRPEILALRLKSVLLETVEWLKLRREDSDPLPVRDYLQRAMVVDAAVRRGKFGRSLELEVAEILRRCERGLGMAVRKGQAEGTIGSRDNPGNRPRQSYLRNGQLVHVRDVPRKTTASPRDFIPSKQYSVEIYALTDDISDETFDQAIAEARAQGNLSRANLLRKLAGEPPMPEDFSRAPRRHKAQRIAELAEAGLSSRQMATRLKISDDRVRNIAREYNVEIPADKIIARTRRHDSNRIVTQTVDTLASLVLGLDLVEYDDIDPAEVSQWVTSMDESFRALNRFRIQLKKVTHQQ